MEFKMRANIIMSKELTVEANDLSDALEKAKAKMAEPIPYRDLTPRKIYYDEISPMKWMDESRFRNVV